MTEETRKVELKVIDLGISVPDKPKIMVVDDEPALQSLVFDTLGDDYRILTAHNGREAVERIPRIKPDLVLMDVMMPDIGGYEAVQMLRDNPEANHIPVVMITANDFDTSTVSMIKQEPNVKGFLSKPFKPTQLRETVKKVLEEKK